MGMTLSLAKDFLGVHWDRVSPLLLGYSGGPDSKALLYTLLEFGISPHIAHVDHGWRSESREEAEKLKEEARSLDLPFHTIRLSPAEKNREDAARKGRYAFFQSIYGQAPFQALLLAHQAEDLAETVLKRIFEGASLPFLGGMKPVSEFSGMTIWRPFLKTRRSKILAFLEEKSLTPLIDPSNADSAYLRARMRLEIFPYLTESFGKEIVDNLVLLSERSHELREYLDGKTDRMEQKHLLQRLAKEHSLKLSREMIDRLTN